MAKVLIVEDEKPLNDAYQIVLKKAGHSVMAAYDGSSGLEIFEKQKPDLILLDLRMPEMSGIEFLKNLDSDKKTKSKIIIFSNYDDPKEIDEAFKLGADRYILKAWSSPHELVKVVKETLAKHKN